MARTTHIKYIVSVALTFSSENPTGLLIANEEGFDDLVEQTMKDGHSNIHWLPRIPDDVFDKEIPKLIVSKPFHWIPFVTVHCLTESRKWWWADIRFVCFFNFAGKTIPVYTYHTHWSDDQ